jgi:phosphatidylglycerophosphate synthase
MKFKIKHRITITDKIFIALLLIALVVSILFNETKIIALLIVIPLISVNILDYVRKKQQEKDLSNF